MRNSVYPFVHAQHPDGKVDLGILSVSRLISREASPIFYQENTFNFYFTVHECSSSFGTVEPEREFFSFHPKINQMKSCILQFFLENPEERLDGTLDGHPESRTGACLETILNDYEMAVKRTGTPSLAIYY